jgi:hypothetical protein
VEGRVAMEEGREECGGVKGDGEAPLLLLEVKASYKGGRLAHMWVVSAGRYSGERVWRQQPAALARLERGRLGCGARGESCPGNAC